jgi:hypothetical protein
MTEGAPTWFDRVKGVWPYATAVTTLMFVATSLVGGFIAWQSGADEFFSYVLAAADPAVASLGMLAVCLAKPDVFAGKRFRMPHLLTLPTLFLVIVYAIKSLGRLSAASVRRIEGAERFDLIWLDPAIVVEAWLVLVLVMVAVGVFAGERDGVE